MTLRNKLLAFTAVLVLLPGVIIGAIAERYGRESLGRAIGARLAREADHASERIALLLRSERETLEGFARQEVMREIRVGDIDKRIAQALLALRDGSEARRGYLLVNTVDEVVAATDPGWIGPLPLWARGADDFALRSVTDVRGRSHDVLLETAVVPDPDSPGATLGELVVLIDREALRGVAESLRRDLEREGTIVSVLLVGLGGETLLAVGDSEVSLAAESWARVASGFPGGAQTASDSVVAQGLDSIVGRATLGSDLPSWKLLVAQSRSLAFAPARDLRNRIVLTMALALASALALATFGARLVTRPLTELTAGIRSLSRVDPSILQVPVRSRDEVGSLALAFNHMANELDRVQQDLVEAEKFAFVGELASGIAHEVRTSLGVLRSSAQILERALPIGTGADAIELSQMIRAEADRLGGVVDDLLGLDDQRPLHPQPMKVSDVVLRAALLVEPQAEEKGIRIVRRVRDDEIQVLCDPEAVHQVALNLLVNAVDALGEGGTVELEILEAHEGYGGFVVRDDGAGVPEALRDKIFKPFVTAKEGGVGLGLTFVKRVVHEQQGRISLIPSPDGGACFRVELPQVAGSAGAVS